MAKSRAEYKKELEEFKDGLSEGWENDYNKVFDLARKYYNAGDYSTSVRYYDKVILLNPNYSSAYNNKAVSLSQLGKKQVLINLYLQSLSLNRTSSIVFSNLLTNIMNQNKFATIIPKIIDKPDIYDNKLKDIVDYAVTVATPRKIKYFKLFDGIAISEKCKDYDRYFWVKYIFDATAEDTEIRPYIIALYKAVLEIKQALLCKDMDSVQIGHYTRIENVKHLVSKEGGKLRLGNVAYVNDPSEGNLFLELFADVSKGQTLSEYYSAVNGKGQRQIINNSATYLGSFSTSIDSLPLWVQYGNNGKGCCLILNKACFDEADDSFVREDLRKRLASPNVNDDETLIKVEPDDKTGEVKKVDKYCLYKVVYADNIEKLKSNKEIYGLLNDISDLLPHIDKRTKKMSDKQKQDAIRQLVINAIDQIRFLFKTTGYAHENELRLVITSYEPKADEGEREKEIPHLFVEMNKELKYDEIILGPRLDKPSEVAPYIYFTEKVKAITKSSIRYQ